jgi:hypothetical protein
MNPFNIHFIPFDDREIFEFVSALDRILDEPELVSLNYTELKTLRNKLQDKQNENQKH